MLRRLLPIALVACSAPTGPIPIGLEFRPDAPLACPSEQCADYAFDCDVVVSIRVFDASGDPFDTSTPLAQSCITASSGANLCDLAALDVPPLDVSAERVRVELAVWPITDRPSGTCPTDAVFDLAGLPLDTANPAPAFAGARIVDLANPELDAAVIPLACRTDDPLALCNQPQTDIIANIDDIDTLLVVDDVRAEQLRVSIAEPQSRVEGGATLVHFVDPNDEHVLPLDDSGPAPVFADSVSLQEGASVCTLVLDAEPQSTTSATCGATIEAVTTTLRSYHVSKERLDQLLSAIGLADFPEEGLVIGRVVDAFGLPSADTLVTAMSPTNGVAEVLYVNADFTSAAADTGTTSHGFFVSKVAPFGSTWRATRSDGFSEQDAVVGGLLEGAVSVVVIELAPTLESE